MDIEEMKNIEAAQKELSEIVKELPGVDLSTKDGKVMVSNRRHLEELWVPKRYKRIAKFHETAGMPDSKWERLTARGFQLWDEGNPQLYWAGLRNA